MDRNTWGVRFLAAFLFLFALLAVVSLQADFATLLRGVLALRAFVASIFLIWGK